MAPPAEEDRAEEKPAEEDIDQHRPLPTHIAPPESMDRQETEDGEDKVEDAGNKWAAAQQKSRDVSCSNLVPRPSHPKISLLQY